MELSDDERAELERLTAKAAAPDVSRETDGGGGGAEDAAQVTAEVAAATVEAVTDAVEAGAHLGAQLAEAAHQEQTDELRDQLEAAQLEAAVAEIQAEVVAEDLAELEEATTVPVEAPEHQVIAEPGSSVEFNDDMGDDTYIEDNAPRSGSVHPWFRSRKDWSAARKARKQK